jgi:homoserine O-acetyltransferase
MKISRRRAPLLACAAVAWLAPPLAALAAYPPPREGTWVAKDVRFASGETMPEVRLHYRTLGSPVRDAQGVVRNAVLILHGTGGSGAQFLQPQFADELFGPGQLLDASRYYIVLPDGIGHGQSTRPSDGLRMKFPRYSYADMVALQHRLLTEGLGVNHLRLVMGTSMGGMQTWMWGYTYSDFMDGLVPLASVPTAIVGRNRIWRKMLMDSIRDDPAWNDGNYSEPPRLGLRGAQRLQLLMGAAPLQWQKNSATRESADAFLKEQVDRRVSMADANDMLYQFDASREYDPSPHLEQIVAPVLAINSADDQINPPDLGLMERLIPRVKRASYVLIPTSDRTRGHGTHTWAAVWKEHLARFLETPGQPTRASAVAPAVQTEGTRVEKGRETPNRVRYLRVWHRRDGAWRAVVQMSTPMPPE